MTKRKFSTPTLTRPAIDPVCFWCEEPARTKAPLVEGPGGSLVHRACANELERSLKGTRRSEVELERSLRGGRS